MTLSHFLSLVRSKFPDCEIRFLHPSLYVVCVSEDFNESTEDQHLTKFATSLQIDSQDLYNLVSTTGIQIVLVNKKERSEYSFLTESAPRPHWIELLANTNSNPTLKTSDKCTYVHFYGYKGGQARSTILSIFGRRLANDGYRVLAIDADLEAPSLAQLLGPVDIRLSNSVMGTVMNRISPEPVNVYARDEGVVDLLAARPSSNDYDLDFAVFVLNTQLDANQLLEALPKSLTSNYDVVLVDHRSGISSSVVPIAVAYPGPLVACMRLDEQSILGLPFYEKLLALSPEIPGLFVTFSLDPETSSAEIRERHNKEIMQGMDIISRLLGRKSNDEIDPNELISYWVPWYHDRTFLQGCLPQVERISKDNRESLSRIRELTGLATRKTSLPQLVSSHPLSGATAEAVFIRTEKISQLFQPNTPYVYAFGRKGTGKTRLVAELLKESLNEPLVVARDANAPIKANSAILDQLCDTYANAPEKLWWTLLSAALQVNSIKSEPENYSTIAEGIANDFIKGDISVIQPLYVATLANTQSKKRVFLIDSIETAFPPRQMHLFVGALFRFLATIQSDPKFTSKVTVRLFLRADLASRYAGQNAEQHFGGKKIDLIWDAQSIFNFVLSRIASLQWFVENFEEPCRVIESRIEDVKAGLLTEEEYQPLLLKFFPEKLKGSNLTSLFFLRTYFSDAPGDDERNAAFYPRLFEQFLNFIANPQDLPGGAQIPQKDSSGFLNHALITRAHEEAAKQYLVEVSQELEFLLDLDGQSKDDNNQSVRSLLLSFNGKRTPFRPNNLAHELSVQNPQLSQQVIRNALDTMHSVGMFEKLQREKDRWRVGRLFKTALGMKFVRGLDDSSVP